MLLSVRCTLLTDWVSHQPSGAGDGQVCLRWANTAHRCSSLPVIKGYNRDYLIGLTRQKNPSENPFGINLEKRWDNLFEQQGAVFLQLNKSCLSVLLVTFNPHGKARASAELSMYVTHIMEPPHLHRCSFHRLDREGWYTGTVCRVWLFLGYWLEPLEGVYVEKDDKSPRCCCCNLLISTELCKVADHICSVNQKSCQWDQ